MSHRSAPLQVISHVLPPAHVVTSHARCRGPDEQETVASDPSTVSSKPSAVSMVQVELATQSITGVPANDPVVKRASVVASAVSPQLLLLQLMSQSPAFLQIALVMPPRCSVVHTAELHPSHMNVQLFHSHSAAHVVASEQRTSHLCPTSGLRHEKAGHMHWHRSQAWVQSSRVGSKLLGAHNEHPSHVAHNGGGDSTAGRSPASQVAPPALPPTPEGPDGLPAPVAVPVPPAPPWARTTNKLDRSVWHAPSSVNAPAHA